MLRDKNVEAKTVEIGEIQFKSLLDFEIKSDSEEEQSFERLDKCAYKHFLNKEYETCLTYLNLALKLSSQTESQINLADLHFNIGAVSLILKKYTKAEENFISCIRIEVKQLGWTHLKIADRCKEMANLFYAHKMKEKYFCYLSKHYEILIKNAVNFFNVANYQVELANCYYHMDAIDSAITAYHLALTMYHKCDDSISSLVIINKVTKVLNKLGIIYFDLRKFDIALDYHQKSLRLQIIPFDQESISSAHTRYCLTLTYEKLGKKGAAINSQKTAIEVLSSFKNEKYADRLKRYHKKLNALEKSQHTLLPSLNCCLSIFQLCKKSSAKSSVKITEEKVSRQNRDY